MSDSHHLNGEFRVLEPGPAFAYYERLVLPVQQETEEIERRLAKITIKLPKSRQLGLDRAKIYQRQILFESGLPIVDVIERWNLRKREPDTCR